MVVRASWMIAMTRHQQFSQKRHPNGWVLVTAQDYGLMTMNQWISFKALLLGSQVRIRQPSDFRPILTLLYIDAQMNRRRKPGQDAARFKTDEDTGKMMIDSDEDEEKNPSRAGADVEGTAYRESISAVDGFTRGPHGRIKFNKDTKKRRRENDEADDIDMVDVEASSAKNKKNKRKSPVKLGQEFKAKVICFNNVCSFPIANSDDRKLAAILKRVALTHMHICHCPKLQRRVDVGTTETGSVLQVSDDCDEQNLHRSTGLPYQFIRWFIIVTTTFGFIMP
jgi:hypothetical protein